MMVTRTEQPSVVPAGPLRKCFVFWTRRTGFRVSTGSGRDVPRSWRLRVLGVALWRVRPEAVPARIETHSEVCEVNAIGKQVR